MRGTGGIAITAVVIVALVVSAPIFESLGFETHRIAPAGLPRLLFAGAVVAVVAAGQILTRGALYGTVAVTLAFETAMPFVAVGGQLLFVLFLLISLVLIYGGLALLLGVSIRFAAASLPNVGQRNLVSRILLIEAALLFLGLAMVGHLKGQPDFSGDLSIAFYYWAWPGLLLALALVSTFVFPEVTVTGVMTFSTRSSS
jgi:hypothetical protein